MTIAATAYAALTGAAREEIGEREPANGAIQVAALTLTKTADGLIDPKLVLAWLLNALGAPAAFVGWLVPVREAGSLLPQLALSRWVERGSRRKYVWAAGSALQGAAALGIGWSALTLEGAAAGWAVIGCLAALALARSLCSLSHKDTLARSISKGRRGAISGAAGAAAAALTLGFGAALALGIIPLTATAISLVVMAAGALWLAAAALFIGLEEAPPEGGGAAEREPGSLLGPLRSDPQLRRFIAARALLTVTALAPPFIVTLSAAEAGESGLGTLGPFVLASAGASILSSYVWGRLSDSSSRRTLMAAGGLAAATLGAAAAFGLLAGGLGGVAGATAALFAAQIAYAGVRQGRKLHLTDMANDANRARYTAVSNTAIGLVLILGGGFGVLAEAAGAAATLAVFAGLAALSIPVAAGLDEVQRRG